VTVTGNIHSNSKEVHGSLQSLSLFSSEVSFASFNGNMPGLHEVC
jgi:hypothetical protein